MKRKIFNLLCSILIIALLIGSFSPSAEAKELPVQLPIIMYHQINNAPRTCNEFTVSDEMFENDIKYLSENGYTSITTKELLAYCKGDTVLPEKPILITIDDGYESFVKYAKPVLERYGMNVVLSIVGSYTDKYTEIKEHCFSYSYFSWKTLSELQQSPAIEFAVHSYDMHKLKDRRGCRIKPGESYEDYNKALNDDLEKVEDRFQEYLKIKPYVFAYPYGLVCKEAKEILEQRGYQILFTCEEGVNELTGDKEELLKLKRFNRSGNLSQKRFFAKIENNNYCTD